MTTINNESRTGLRETAGAYKGARLLLGLTLLALTSLAGQAGAAPVELTNPGFEYPAGASGVLDDVLDGSDPSVGWVKTGGGQIFNPGLDTNAPEGFNSYLILEGINNYNLGSGSILQQLDDTLAEGVYTLEVEVGENATATSSFGSGYQVQLGVMNGTTFVQLAVDDSTLTPSNGFLTSTVTYTADAVDPNLGLPLAIQLAGTVTPGSNNQVLFDDVRLDFVAAPGDRSVYLKTQPFNKPLPGGGTVAMWGFAACTDATYADCTAPAETDAPGPRIDAFAGFELTVNVMNTLPMPVSIMIPGQANTGVPTAAGTRQTSFAAEVDAGASGAYTFSALKAGTYIYHSATYPSVQVPMGLYGAVIVHDDAAAYPGISAASETLLLFSEIDPIQNNRVASYATGAPGNDCVPLDDYMQSMTAGMPCTIDYDPMYFFINGEPTAELPAGDPGEVALLRMANAGLRSHTPAIVGIEFDLIAEDGNLYPIPQQQSAALLAAGKTLDALVTLPSSDITLQLFDRMPTFNNENLPNGGAIGGLVVGAGSPDTPPVTSLAADDGPYGVTEDTDFSLAAPGVLANDTGLSNPTVVGGGPAHGSVALNSDGSFIYTPDPDYSGPDSFTYSADGNLAQVSLSVSFENDAPVAGPDGPFVNGTGDTITVAAPGVLGNDADADGDELSAEIVTDTVPAPAGLTLNADGSLSYTVAAATTASTATFQYRACDGAACSAPVDVTLTHNPVSGLAITVVDENDVVLPADGYRWLVEEDATWQPDPNQLPPPQETLATSFHKSHIPVVAQGVGAVEFAQVALDPAKHYYVSVLPLDGADGDGHTLGGARIMPGADAVTVQVNSHALPTAQISIFVFEDNSPTNGAVDGNEQGLGGFQVTLEDAGGRYGISAGMMSQDAFGQPLTNSLDCFGDAPPAPGIILSCPDTPENRAAGVVGEVLIKNLFPGKYGVITSPPLGATDGWKQTSTIEGSKVIDAWVKAGEPPFFQEFGPAGWHVFVGFVSPSRAEAAKLAAAGDGPTNSVTGTVTNMHMSRPPDQRLWSSTTYDALAHTQAWVGINSASGTGPNYAAVPVDENGVFTIDGLPDGDYQLVIWDAYLDVVIGYKTVTQLAGGEQRNVQDVPVFQWFTRSEHFVFLDDGCGNPALAGDGIREDCETGMLEQNVNLRWRDGTVYQAFPTDTEGFAPFDQTFPFFHWLVFEVDYARFKPTGVTVTVDNGGDVSDSGFVLNPQAQTEGCATNHCTSRTETGPVLTQGYQGFLGQTSTLDWGKVPYAEGENGGISGIVYYSSTRAESNPRLGVGEPWEPGVPGVAVRLYRQVLRSATDIAVENASFEIPVQAASGVIDDVVDGTYGWVKTGGGQIYNPGLDANAPHGFNSYLILNDIAGYNLGSGTVQQTLADVLTEGTYTLTVQVGENATASSSFGNYRVQLGVFNGSEFVLLAEDDNSLAPVNEFLTSTVQYTAAVDNPNLGLPLMIRLVGDVDGTGNIQVLFDDVHLTWSDNGLALVAETQTDSWDASLPDGCPGAADIDLQIVGPGADGVSNNKCYDGLRNFNQVRPAVFDGGYAFGAEGELPPGKYVVEVVPPPGYELVKEEDINVGFGDAYYMDPAGVTFPGGAVGALPDYAMVEDALLEPGLAQPRCVGELREVPPELSLFPVGEPAPFAGATRPLCNRKEVLLSDQGQAAADFFLFTSTPVSARFAGMILDDTAQEFNPLSPQFGEKWAPPFVPVAVLDHLGNEISRVYSDQWGRMNGLVPSTFTANMPSPSGFAPAMLMTCMNDPGPIPDPAHPGHLMLDPQYNPAYSTFCYTFQYMPGTTTYLDTPVVPVSAFASGYNPPDCEAEEFTPKINRVDGVGGAGSGPLTDRGQTLTIHAQATTTIPNPAYQGPLDTPNEPKTITRAFGFGDTQGTVTLDGEPVDPADVEWTDDTITWTVPGNFRRGSYQLEVTNAAGVSTTEAITVEVRNINNPVIRVPGDYGTIQAAIDAADENALILVAPGRYEELVIMWKPVRLQGAGAGSTFLNGVKRPTEKIVNWRAKMDCLFGIGAGCTQVVDALPNQLVGAAGFDTEEGAAITVLGAAGGNFNNARVDGFSITGGDTGGGIFVNGYAGRLQISNNRVFGNSGAYHGGIRVGRPFLELPASGPYAFNQDVSIHHNAIVNNGGLEGAGGGVSLMAGTDDYSVTDNFVCGNFTLGDGGGIGHLGLSDGGVIANNRILFNQSFNQGQLVSGGGIFVGGEPAAVGAVTYGAGDVTIDGNLIQGNQAGGGNGGGIRTQYVNGQDVLSGGLPSWHAISITNNLIVNNMSAGSGAGISMQDTLVSGVFNNTVAHNDSTATLGGLITVNADGTTTSEAQPSGIATQSHSPELANALPTTGPASGLPGFSNPELVNNVVWKNRAFSYLADEEGGARLIPELMQGAVGECDAAAAYQDLGVVGGAGMLNPTSSVLTDTTGYDGSNTSDDPALVDPYCNGARDGAGPMFALPALDEGGNAWIEVRFGPLAPIGDYHIGDMSSGLDNAVDGLVDTDFDGDLRPQGGGTDRGADEFVPPATP